MEECLSNYVNTVNIHSVGAWSSCCTCARARLWLPLVCLLFASQKKNLILVNVMIASSVMSLFAVVIVFVYACVTLSYGEEDDEIFHAHPIPEVRFVFSRMVKGANSTLLLACMGSLHFSSLIAYVGCRSLPLCGCYDSANGMEFLVPQNDPVTPTVHVCSWQDDERILTRPCHSWISVLNRNSKTSPCFHHTADKLSN